MASNDLQKFSDYLQKQGYGGSGKSQDSFSSSSSLELPKTIETLHMDKNK